MSENDAKIIAKMNRLVAAGEEAECLIDELKKSGERLESIGRNIKSSPTSVRISETGSLDVAPFEGPNFQNRFSTEEFNTVVQNIKTLQALTEEIERIKIYLKEEGYAGILKDD